MPRAACACQKALRSVAPGNESAISPARRPSQSEVPTFGEWPPIPMWFNDEVISAYEKSIKPAVSEAGFEPVRIDRKEHSYKICDEVVAEIRRARFLVCDFTCGLLPDSTAESGETAVARGGVYYEAGFAHGVGMMVIWTCRSDLIDHVHFDLRQYNSILWEDGKGRRISAGTPQPDSVGNRDLRLESTAYLVHEIGGTLQQPKFSAGRLLWSTLRHAEGMPAVM